MLLIATIFSLMAASGLPSPDACAAVLAGEPARQVVPATVGVSCSDDEYFASGVTEEIIGDPEASRWLDRTKREPWSI